VSLYKFTSRLFLGGLLACTVLTPIAWADAITPQTISNAITAANVLDADATMRVAVSGDNVYVSTYRNPSENENDCKINAVLVAKAVFSAAGDAAARVTVYFYSATEPGKYQEVSVSAGDVKAFGSGATSQEQLLKSIAVEHKQQSNDADRITQQLQNNAYARPDYRVDMASPAELVVTSILGSWVPDVEAKLEAVHIANIAAQYAPASAQTIKVSFRDPRSPNLHREVNLSKEEAQSKWAAMEAALKDMSIAKVQIPVDPATIQPVAGVALPERLLLLNRIRELAHIGIGTVPFINAFQQIEASVPNSDEGSIKAAVSRLNASLDEQAQAYKMAKETKFAKAELKADSSHVSSGKDLGRKNYWFHGQFPFAPDVIANNPDDVIARCERTCGGAARADRDRDFLGLLDYMIVILRADNNKDEADKLATRAGKIRQVVGR
jgi:hypothetical protein